MHYYALAVSLVCHAVVDHGCIDKTRTCPHFFVPSRMIFELKKAVQRAAEIPDCKLGRVYA